LKTKARTTHPEENAKGHLNKKRVCDSKFVMHPAAALKWKRDGDIGSERDGTKDAIIKIKPATNLRNQLEIIYMFIRN